jgi:alkaline phosphatase D
LNDRFALSRRALLVGLSASALITGFPLARQAQGRSTSAAFHHGVASGDPDANSVVLWTRVTAPAALPVHWELSLDAGFTQIVQRGKMLTGPDRDFTVKVIASGLIAGAEYFYRFRAAGATSPVGKTRTLPRGNLNKLGIALASCSNYAFGYFNAYDAIAKDAAIDFVLHTGDYIYEYGADSWGSDVAKRIGRVHAPAHEIVSLADYRTRHAQYKTDAGSQAMLAAKPLIACWDDHESTNNPWTGGAQNHQPDQEGDWALRRAASIQAYYEWMPVREPAPGRTRMEFWRTYAFGNLATLTTLETRHTARALQIDYREHAPAIQSLADAARFEREMIGAPNRTMIAPALEDELTKSWEASKRDGMPWRLIGNPMPIARTRVPDVVALGIIPDPEKQTKPIDAARELAWKGKWNLPIYPDTWDGYAWARERLYAQARKAGVNDLIFLTGDSHSFWANRLADDQGQPMGIEIGTAGISSPGDFVESGFGESAARRLDDVIAAHNPEILWTDNMHQGYVRLELERAAGRATYVSVDNLAAPQYQTAVVGTWRVERHTDRIDLTRA